MSTYTTPTIEEQIASLNAEYDELMQQIGELEEQLDREWSDPGVRYDLNADIGLKLARLDSITESLVELQRRKKQQAADPGKDA